MEVVLVVFLLDKIGNLNFSIFSPPPPPPTPCSIQNECNLMVN